jgi:hypothetical protein
VLVGHAPERRRIDDLLATTRGGRSAALVLRGPPGIAKTTLLAYAAAGAGDMTVVELVGTEDESKLAFAGLASLVRPLSIYLSDLVPRQRGAIDAALALGPSGATDRMTVSAATLALLVRAAKQRPVLLLVDDVHWLDEPSLEALSFAVRRLRADAVAVLLAVRDDEPAPAGLVHLDVGPLAFAEAVELLGRSRVAPMVAARMWEATAGNPLAMVAAAGLLTDAQRRGAAALDDPLPAGSAQGAFAKRIAGLPGPTQRALLVACADGSGKAGPVLTALAGLGLHPDALVPAERAGLVVVAGGRLSLRHPLVRSRADRQRGEPTPRRRQLHA